MTNLWYENTAKGFNRFSVDGTYVICSKEIRDIHLKARAEYEANKKASRLFVCDVNVARKNPRELMRGPFGSGYCEW